MINCGSVHLRAVSPSSSLRLSFPVLFSCSQRLVDLACPLLSPTGSITVIERILYLNLAQSFIEHCNRTVRCTRLPPPFAVYPGSSAHQHSCTAASVSAKNQLYSAVTRNHIDERKLSCKAGTDTVDKSGLCHSSQRIRKSSGAGLGQTPGRLSQSLPASFSASAIPVSIGTKTGARIERTAARESHCKRLEASIWSTGASFHRSR